MKLNDRIIFIFLIILFVTFLFINSYSRKSELVLLDYASFKATNEINNLINQSINTVLYNNSYENIIKESKDAQGNIVDVDFDNLIVNRLLYLITENLMSGEIEIINNKVYYLPLGLIYNIPVLNNLGPKIPYKMDIIKSVNNEARINVKEYGINSSIIELVINIDMKAEVIMPFKSKIVNVNKNIILDSKIVQGRVPNYYGGFISGSLK